ncbi:hypothetical protein HYQ46_002802 [Verticillium longisporum]|nr:hypothetical protein HYQ46_002802 [Verticillium longisporum]
MDKGALIAISSGILDSRPMEDVILRDEAAGDGMEVVDMIGIPLASEKGAVNDWRGRAGGDGIDCSRLAEAPAASLGIGPQIPDLNGSAIG